VPFLFVKKREEDVVMDRKTLEECLKIYPDINKEIKQTEEEIERLKNVIQEYQTIDCNKFPEVEHVIEGVVDAANSALQYHTERLGQLREACHKIRMVFAELPLDERKIIALRFWNNSYFPTKWKDVASALKYDHCTVERKYKKMVDRILAS